MIGDDAQKKRRIAIIGVSTIFLVAMVVAVTVGVNFNLNGSNGDADDNKTHVTSTVKAVKTLCEPTDYKTECEKSLRAEAGNTTDPRELIKIAFNVTIKEIGNGLKKTGLMHEVEKDPRAKMALDTCKQLMDLSIGEFERSLEKMGKFDLDNLDNILNSLKVWLSGAITYQETCLDGFENTTNEAGKKMKNVLTSTMHMSSNALAIISELANTVSQMNLTKDGRRLVEDSGEERVFAHDDVEVIPSWFDDGVGVRRLLHESPHKAKPNVVVAKDGNGKYKSINHALKQVPEKNQKPFVIYIKEGVYHEYVEVTKNMTHVVFVGDGGKKTRITGNKNFMDGVNTYRTPTVAQGRKERHQPSGIVIQGGSIVSDHTVKFDNKAYLARPWKNYSRAIFMDTYIGDLIQPDGYMPWQGPSGLSGMKTCFYAEYNNTGPGSNKSKRVKWHGIKTLTSQSASRYLPYTFFHGDDWIKVTRIPYSSAVTAPKH
ncbi:putative pectinesterase/pectinesterase inhibitor 28 [Spatholobus suberectus]|nr:putative pectinesterase/pectinesterase inhibitor 28 [Spatholobus suberectus]